MKNILILLPALSQGGAEKSTILIANYLADKYQYKITLCVLEESDFLLKYIDIRVEKFFLRIKRPKGNDFFTRLKNYRISHSIFYGRTKALITNPKFDYVVASQEVISDFPLIRYCQSLFKKAEVYKKFVLTYHNTVTLINQSFGGSLGKRDFKTAIKIRNKYITKQIAVSPEIKKLAQIENPNSVTLIPACLDLKDVHVKSKSGIASKIKAEIEGCPYFIVLARISPVKNLKLVINAFAKFEDTHKNFKLIIAGRVEYPAYFKELLELAGSLNLGGKVIFTGEIENPLPLLKDAKALICSSDNEGMPLSIVESMTLNIPVISSMYPGYDFMITPQNSLLFACGDEESLCQNMINLVEERVNIKEILSKAYDTAKRFDVSVVGEIYHNYFRTRNLTEY